MTEFPPPDAPRADVDAWLAEHAPLPSPLDPRHEVPFEANGPSPMCNGCGVVRISIAVGSFCRDCRRQIELATGMVVR